MIAFYKNDIFKNIATLFSSSVIAQLIPFLLYPFLTRLYSPTDFGSLSLFLAVLSILEVAASGRYEYAIILAQDKNNAYHLSFISLLIAFIISGLCFLFILLNSYIPLWNLDIQLLYLMPLAVLFASIMHIYSQLAIKESRFTIIAGINISQSLLNSFLKLSFALLGWYAGGLIWGHFTALFLVALFILLLIPKQIPFDYQIPSKKKVFSLLKEYKQFPFFNLPHALSNSFSGNLPIFIFSSYFSKDIAGFYSLGLFLILKPVGLVADSFSKVIAKRCIDQYQSGEIIYPDVKRTLLVLFSLGIFPFLLLMYFSPLLFSYMFGKEWINAGVYLQYLLPWVFLIYLTSPFSFIFQLFKQQKKAMMLDFLYLGLRIIALGIGVFLNNVYIALLLFSGIGFLYQVYILNWYLNLSKSKL